MYANELFRLDLAPKLRNFAIMGATAVTAMWVASGARADSLMPTSKVKANVMSLSGTLHDLVDKHVPGTYKKPTESGGTLYGYSYPVRGKNGKVTYTQYSEVIYPNKKMPLVSIIVFGANQKQYSRSEHYNQLNAMADDGSIVAALTLDKSGLGSVSDPKARNVYYGNFFKFGQQIMSHRLDWFL